MTLSSPDEQRIHSLVSLLDSGASLSTEKRDEMLEAFEQFECWNPYFRLIKRNLENPETRVRVDFVRLARVQNLCLEDVFAAAETCAQLVSVMRVPYQQFVEEVLQRVVDSEDYAAEATILSAVLGQFLERADHIACLERLCMLYEKKTHNEVQLQSTYEKLLAADPRNVKALRYFKLILTQNNDWEEVVGILKTLLGCVNHKQEIFRVAQELASIYLYQLDMAEESIAVVNSYCADSPLDTSTILYDAYTRLSDWPGCLKILRQSLLAAEGDAERAILHLKMGSLHEQMSELDKAVENFARAAHIQPDLLDAVEGVINVAVTSRNWNLLQTTLQDLSTRVRDERLAAQINQAAKRLQDGLSHAK